MKRTLLFFSLLVAACSSRTDDALLKELDSTLALSETYENAFISRVNVMRELYDDSSSAEQKYDLGRRIAGEFLTYSLDSTVRYLDANRILAGGDKSKITETDLLRVRVYAKAGYYPDALEIFSRYTPEEVPPSQHVLYYDTGATLYGELAVYTNNPAYWILRDSCVNVLMPILEEGTFGWYNRERAIAEKNNDKALAKELCTKMIEISPSNSHEYAEAAFFFSTYLESDSEKIEWLARSAIADAVSATKDYASLTELAVILYRRGDVNRAFRYLADHSMPDAIFYNGKLRPWQIARFFPEIQRAYDSQEQRTSRRMTAMLSGLGVLSLLLVGLLSVLIGRQRTLRRTRAELELSKASLEERNAALVESGRIRQEYITLFLGTLSDNIEKDRKYKNHVLKYLRRGDDKYLIEEIEALPSINGDIQAFYKMFDDTFCKLYPGFVEKFNSLLSEGEAILPKGEDLLSPELRVFALIKLGITDSTEIASLLHYSTNTIYNYRAKVRNKARGDRDSFENKVMAIE